MSAFSYAVNSMQSRCQDLRLPPAISARFRELLVEAARGITDRRWIRADLGPAASLAPELGELVDTDFSSF